MKYKICLDLDFKRNKYPGKLIAFEGIDASGKTTQVKLLKKALERKGKRVFLTKNPTRKGPIGRLIHKVLRGKIKVPLVSFQYLYSADRQVQQIEIIEHLKKGNIVITDRYFWSSIAYGISDREATDYKNVTNFLLISQSILSMYYQFLIPDVSFYLDISTKEAIKRLSLMSKEKEIYENTTKLDKIRDGYLFVSKMFKKEIIKINGEKKINDINKEILKDIKKIL